MTEGFERPRERTMPAQVHRVAIQPGWTVHDSLGRAVGNVADVEDEVMRVDGRPEGMGFLDVPLTSVREIEDGHVRLGLELEQIGRPDWAERSPSRDAAQYGDAEAAFQGTRPVGEVTWRVDPAPAGVGGTTGPERMMSGSDVQGSSYTASGTPVGPGSNTPVGNEPSTYQAWDAEMAAEPRPQYVLWSAGAGAAAAAAGLYAWWYQRQRRQSRLRRVKRAFATAGDSLTPLLGLVGTLQEAGVGRQAAWWLAPLAAVPLGLYLRSADPETMPWGRRSGPPAVNGWKDRLRSVAASAPDMSNTPRAWRFALPGLAAAIAATRLVGRQRQHVTDGRERGGNRRLSGIMTRNVEVARPDSTLFDAAATMRRLDVGALPVCDGRRLLGMLTDRDIVVRSVAESRDPHLATAGEAMTAGVVYAFADDSIARAAELMRQHRIRRLPIVDREKQLVGIVSLGDLAVDAGDDRLSGETLERVSEPALPRR
jgi:CBS domain-containing protein